MESYYIKPIGFERKKSTDALPKTGDTGHTKTIDTKMDVFVPRRIDPNLGINQNETRSKRAIYGANYSCLNSDAGSKQDFSASGQQNLFKLTSRMENYGQVPSETSKLLNNHIARAFQPITPIVAERKYDNYIRGSRNTGGDLPHPWCIQVNGSSSAKPMHNQPFSVNVQNCFIGHKTPEPKGFKIREGVNQSYELEPNSWQCRRKPEQRSPPTDYPSLQQTCSFCKSNSEKESVYMSHVLRNSRGHVTCPVLFGYECEICHATGINAHTITYCPFNRRNKEAMHFQAPTKCLKNTLVKSNGCRRRL